ncbi:MAG: hypothetical protein WC900_04465 [Oscillospiraceae bacterium]|jgi:uncharacterized membrane protein YeaQ/YmgE (transglycosylase-associated protein family)
MLNYFYKPSNKFTVKGVLLVLLAVAVVGSILAPVYLKLIDWIPFIYLNILMTAIYGAVIGLVVSKIVEKTKIRNVIMVLLAVLVGSVIVTAVKWSLYCYWDNDSYWGIKDFRENFTESDYVEFDDIIYEELGFHFADSPIDYLTSPKELINYIKYVNEEGRWNIKASVTAEGTDNYVKGGMLWLVWLIEAGIIIIIPVLMGIKKARYPFIEIDDDWAIKHEKEYNFKDVNLRTVKYEIARNPRLIFDYEYLENIGVTRDFTTLTLFHSRDFQEGYISLSRKYFNEKKKDKYNTVLTVEYINVDKAFIDELWSESFANKPENTAQKAAEEASAAAMRAAYSDTPSENCPMDGISVPDGYNSAINDIEK